MRNSINLKNLSSLQKDNVFVSNSIIPFNQLTNMTGRKGYEQAVISNEKIVNIVSNSYGHLPNENFFTEIENRLIEADIQYVTRSINRDDRSFAVDYILIDERYH